MMQVKAGAVMGDLIYYNGNWFNSEEDLDDYFDMRYGECDIPDPFNER
jgi:hypothetical protein